MNCTLCNVAVPIAPIYDQCLCPDCDARIMRMPECESWHYDPELTKMRGGIAFGKTSLLGLSVAKIQAGHCYQCGELHL